jgi:sterol desaturase/sphingolipid hydroxylase (fatty acid hydroxylase superfamily)
MADNLPDLVSIAIPAFMALICAEMLWARRFAPDAYDPKDMITCLLLGFTAFLMAPLLASSITAACDFAAQYRIANLPSVWWVWMLCVFADDFLHYALHRTSHRMRILWASHVVHHSSQHFNFAVGLRQSASIVFLSSLAFRFPLILAGFPAAMVAFVITANQIFQFWTHTQMVRRCPQWIEYIFVTPSHHRVHHAVNPEYLDRNFGGVFIVWDRMFGTFQQEQTDCPPRYGIVHQLGRFNLLVCIFHEWVAILKDVWNKPWRSKFGYAFAPPGWSHDRSRDTTDAIKEKWRAAQVIDGEGTLREAA